VLSVRDRRGGYAFACCTRCGPRYSVVEALPYDRAYTSMREFVLCAACSAEYHDPRDRRFHAQATACPQCGPQLQLFLLPGAREAGGDDGGQEHALDGRAGGGASHEGDALGIAAALLRGGKIVAVKGLGGFSLLVDATQAEAVARLRHRKQRPTRPLACLAPDRATIGRWCEVDEHAAQLLSSPAGPIVLLPLLPPRPTAPGSLLEGLAETSLPQGVAPGLASVGWMLPSTPLHHLLLAAVGRPLVCTSANRRGEPICTDAREVEERLGTVADAVLDHNRTVVRPLDDSVVRWEHGQVVMIRRARGYVPEPLELPGSVTPTLALGGHLKATICLVAGRQAWLSQHLGDLDSLRAYELLERTVTDLVERWGLRPQRLACDLHPSYASTRLAEQLAQRWGLELVRVQHHHAHLLATVVDAWPRGRAEELAGAVTGLAWDGVGWGADATWWGGEALVLSPLSAPRAYQRVATLRPIRLLGGDGAARDPRRVAVALLWDSVGAEAAQRFAEQYFDTHAARVLGQLAAKPHLAAQASSMGRLFDGVAALLGVCPRPQTYEGEAPALLEASATTFHTKRSHTAPPAGSTQAEGGDACRGSLWPEPVGGVLDWAPLVRGLVQDVARGLDPGGLAWRFHQALAEAACLQAAQGSARGVVLGGGCWNNALLRRLACDHLRARGFEPWVAQQVPCGDGGLSLGQAWAAGYGSGGAS
jgi:hydrogenase maturation protein HypF